MPLPESAACPSFSNEFEKEDKPMAKPYKIPDFRKLYPEASEEVIAVLRTTERKMQYQEYDLKTERTIIDHKTQTVQYLHHLPFYLVNPFLLLMRVYCMIASSYPTHQSNYL